MPKHRSKVLDETKGRSHMGYDTVVCRWEGALHSEIKVLIIRLWAFCHSFQFCNVAIMCSVP
jgi:hypothetical protein